MSSAAGRARPRAELGKNASNRYILRVVCVYAHDVVAMPASLRLAARAASYARLRMRNLKCNSQQQQERPAHAYGSRQCGTV